jgi:hypothetical protein
MICSCENSCSLSVVVIIARVRRIVNKGWQLSVYKGEDWGELYDLENDRRQTCNLWVSAEQAATKAAIFEELA